MHKEPRIPADPYLAGLFASRGKIHAHRYFQTKDSSDLQDAISAMRVAVILYKETRSVMLGPALGNLAALLLEQFKSTQRDFVLNEALQFARWALECLPKRDPDMAPVFVTLGTILSDRYDRSKRNQDLEEAIASLQIAAQLRGPSDDGALSAVISNNVVCVMEKRYDSTGRRQDLSDTINAALQATKIELPNNPSLVVGMYSNLASLLTRRFEATGKLDGLTDALFELRIATKVAQESISLDSILGHLSGLVKEQHALRAQPMDEKIEMFHLRHSTSLILLFILFMFLSLSVAHSLAFCLLIAFLGGIILDWVFQICNGTTSNDWPRELLRSTPNWIQKILSPYHRHIIDPALCSTPWIDSRSEEEPYRSERWRMPMSTRTTPFESNRDEEWKTKPILQSLGRNRERVGVNLVSIYPGSNNKLSHTPPFRSNPPLQVPSRAVGYYEDMLEIQKRPLYTESADSGFWNDDLCDSPSGRERLGISLDVSEERRDSTCANNPNDCAPNLATETRETQEMITDTIGVPRSCPSRQSAIEVAILEFLENDDAVPTSTKNLPREDAAEPQDKPSSIATKETPTSSNPTHSDHGSQIFNDKKNILGQKFVDRKVHSRRPPTNIEKDSSVFDSVAQGNTSNGMNKNEGNAMGNIYSEEANVVGHLSRHYGDIFETKNISTVLRESQTPGLRSSQKNQEATMDKSYTENIPQEVLDEYIRDLRNPSEEDQRSGHQKAPQRRKAKHGPSDISGGDAENGSQFSTSAEEIFRGVAKGGMKGVDDDTFSTFSLLNGGRPRRGPPSMANFYSQESPRPSTPVPTAHSNHHSSDPEIKPSGSSLGEVFDLTVPENRLLNKSAAQPLSKHVDLPRQFDFAEKRRPTSTVMGVTSGETGRPKSQQSGTDSRYIQIYSVRNRNDIHAGHSTHLRRQGGEYSVVKDPDRDTDGGPVPEQSDGSYSEDDLSIRRSNGAYFGRSRSHRLKKNATETRHSPEPYGRRTGDANIARVYTKRPTPVDGASNYGSDDGLESVQRIRTSKAARNSTSRPSPEPRIIRSATTGARRTRRSGDEIPPRALKIELAPKIKNLDNAHDQVQTLWSYFKEVLKPVCDSFIARLPDLHDSKKREFEYKVLSELMVTQVLLQADSIEPGDDETTRSSRRRLIKEVQAGLNVLDAHVGSLSLPQIL